MSRAFCWLPLVAAVVCGPTPGALMAQTLLERLGGIANQREDARPPATRAGARENAPGYLGLLGDESEGEDGVIIVEVEEGTPAARAGFKVGDRIVRIGNTPIENLDQLARSLQPRRAGDRVDFVVVRDGREYKLAAQLVTRPIEEEPVDDALPPAGIPEDAPPLARLGVISAPVSAALRARYGFAVEEGAVITGIEPGSPAHRQRLPIGGVIVDVNGQPIASPEDLQDIVAASRVGDELELTYYVGNKDNRRTVQLAPALPRTPAERRALTARRPGPDMEDRLGEGGRRPLLGRIGRVLDEIVEEEALPSGEPLAADPGPALAPAGGEDLPAASETELLREEVELLRQEIDILRRRIDELERRTR